MSNYYVSSKGTTGAGTIGNPWGVPDLLTAGTPYTQGVALTTLVAGDTLYFIAGDYHISGATDASYFSTQLLCPTHSGTASQPITLQAYPGQTVRIFLDAGAQPVFGTETPALNYVRFIVDSGLHQK